MNYEKIKGDIIEYVYEAEDSLYKVAKVSLYKDEIVTITGYFPMLEIGLKYIFIGEYIEHPKYGKQFIVKSYQRSNNLSFEGIVSYLSSGRFPGIGKKIAKKIVNALGTNAISRIIEDKNVLNNISGLNDVKKDILYEELRSSALEEEMFIKLYSYGLTNRMIEKLYEIYGVKTLNVIEEDPYRLCYEVEGFGFKKCDVIALKLGFKENDIRRIKAAVQYTLTYVSYNNGFTYLTKMQLINSTKNLLSSNIITDTDYIMALEGLVKDGKIVFENDNYYDSYLYYAELNLANKILLLRDTPFKPYSNEKTISCINEVESHLNITYTPLQKEAIYNAINNKLSIITGGPGTGKSTILKGILYTYAALNHLALDSEELMLKVILASPTGRAAKRMSEVTLFKASTIHKALMVNYEGNFVYNKDNLLHCSLLIVDEVSMLDVSLAWSLFQALSNKCQIILVGDINQLPSVGPGNVLSDLITSNIFKITRLNQIIRQASDSDIVKLSNMILNERIDYSIFNKKDVYFYNIEQKDIINFIYRLLDKYKNANPNSNPLIDNQILIPMYAGNVGINEINRAIQNRYNTTQEFVKRGDLLIKRNDKVLQIKNDSGLNVMNGDIGIVLDIVKDEDEKTSLRIDFDGMLVDYPAKLLENLTLAYAMSIHKSQGSEFKNVIMIFDKSYYIMLKKKIIYTGITRAKKKLILIGNKETLNIGISTLDSQRQTSLASRFIENIELKNKIYDSEIPFDTFGEYDMDGITPYTFMDRY